MLEFNGKLYARVSEVISPFANFQGIPKEVLDNKAALGTRVHHAIQNEIEGNFPVVGLQEQPYVQSFEKWRHYLHPTFLKTEVRCYCNKKMLTGCIDALVKLEGEEKAVLVDWKTSVNESPITWPMQAHLYYYLLKETGIEVSDRFLFIKLNRSGDLPRVFQYNLDTNILKSCLQSVDDFWERNGKS